MSNSVSSGTRMPGFMSRCILFGFCAYVTFSVSYSRSDIMGSSKNLSLVNTHTLGVYCLARFVTETCWFNGDEFLYVSCMRGILH